MPGSPTACSRRPSERHLGFTGRGIAAWRNKRESETPSLLPSFLPFTAAVAWGYIPPAPAVVIMPIPWNVGIALFRAFSVSPVVD